MRTNELVAGLRSDVAVLIYGDELAQLIAAGNEVARVVRAVRGAEDVRVEQVAGLKYLRILPDRAKLAGYGLAVADINTVAEAIAAGRPVGVVFERDRRFNVLVKVPSGEQVDLRRLAELPLKAPAGMMIPLGEVAALHIEEGPAEINRSGGSRRLTIEFNVRGRDLLSVVKEAQALVASRVRLPIGYRMEWGGQFEHYVAGKQRLLVIVPIALGLILLLLWLAFRSMRVGLLVFLSVPLAAVGGVLALAVRGLPFSIAAGVGFIALAGVAILNGLVLVAAAHQIEGRGLVPALAIDEAARRRLRPVLMTALVAALGFVPMALSTAPGSEVQRPLATVVIGGVVSAALLTLIVLPVVYGWLVRAPEMSQE
jgi:cobalt-zinc-cadmium resistance protein CzcA